MSSEETTLPGSYIRKLYGVPAFLNGWVSCEDRQGRIVDFDGQYLLVRYSPDSSTVRLHPTWVDYLDSDAKKILHRGEER